MTPNETLMREAYARFANGDIEGMLAMCSDDIVFHVPGTTPFSGDHTKATFGAWIGKVMEICGGKFREDIVDIAADDRHAIVMLDHFIERGGKPVEYRTDHIWQIRDRKCTEFLERPGSEEEFNRAWS